jgi:ribosomal protein L37E
MHNKTKEEIQKEALAYSGANFIGKNGNIYLVRCPRCDLENYVMNAPQGLCTWCGWPHEIEEEKKDE